MARPGKVTWLALGMLSFLGLPLSLTMWPLHPPVAPAHGSGSGAGAVEKARMMAREHLARENLPGLSVAVGVGGKVAWAEGFGWAEIRTGAPVTTEHRFRLGTASILLTAAAAGLLVEEARLQLDDEIQRYAPALPRLKLRALMSHTAGLAAEEQQLFKRHCDQPGEALRYLDPASPALHGWILVSAAIDGVEPFYELLQRRVFDAVGMRNTGVDPGPTEVDDDFPLFNLVRELIYDPRARRGWGAAGGQAARVSYYSPRFGSDPSYGMHLMRPLDLSCYSGAGGFVSTPSDLVRFAMATMAGRVPKLVATLAGRRQGRMVGYNGDLPTGGMAASIWWLPEERIAVAVTANVAHAATFSLAARIGEAFVQERGPD